MSKSWKHFHQLLWVQRGETRHQFTTTKKLRLDKSYKTKLILVSFFYPRNHLETPLTHLMIPCWSSNWSPPVWEPVMCNKGVHPDCYLLHMTLSSYFFSCEMTLWIQYYSSILLLITLCHQFNWRKTLINILKRWCEHSVWWLHLNFYVLPDFVQLAYFGEKSLFWITLGYKSWKLLLFMHKSNCVPRAGSARKI